jgi:hypothetical protein
LLIGWYKWPLAFFTLILVNYRNNTSSALQMPENWLGFRWHFRVCSMRHLPRDAGEREQDHLQFIRTTCLCSCSISNVRLYPTVIKMLGACVLPTLLCWTSAQYLHATASHIKASIIFLTYFLQSLCVLGVRGSNYCCYR